MRFRYAIAPLVLALTSLTASAEQHKLHKDNHQQHQAEQASLAAHVHGLATLNVAFDGQQLELQLESPAMNIVGFEYQPSSAADYHAVAEAERKLKDAQALFTFTNAAHCSLSSITLDHDLTAEHEHAENTDHEHAAAHAHKNEDHHAEHEHEHEHEQHEHAHSDIQAHYIFNCRAAEKLNLINAAGFFKVFPATDTIHVQLVTPTAQHGTELSVSKTQLNW